MADHVADGDGEAAVSEVHGVVPVPADIERADRGQVAHRHVLVVGQVRASLITLTPARTGHRHHPLDQHAEQMTHQDPPLERATVWRYQIRATAATVRKVLRSHRIPPAPKRDDSPTWRMFA